MRTVNHAAGGGMGGRRGEGQAGENAAGMLLQRINRVQCWG